MAQPRFSAGERISLVRSKAFSPSGSNYRVVRALPLETGPQLYRIKSETENFERVIEESRMEAAEHE